MRFRPFSRLASTALACGLAAAAAADPIDGLTAATPDAAAGAAVAAAPALTPAQSAFRDGLAAALTGIPPAQAAAIAGFYAARGYAPFWTEPGSDRAAALAAALDAAPAQALPRRSDDIEALTSLFGPTAAPASDAEREVAAARAYLGLADDVAAGVLAPGSLYADIQVRPSHPAPAALMALLDKAPLPDVLAGLAARRPRLRPARRREGAARVARRRRLLGAGRPRRPDHAPGRRRPAGLRAARPSGTARLPRPRRRDRRQRLRPDAAGRGRGLPGRLRPQRRRRRRLADPRRDQRARPRRASRRSPSTSSGCAG